MNEEALLLRSARAVFAADGPACPGPDVDLDRLLWLAGEHGLLPVLFRHLADPGPVLREALHANGRRNLFLAGELLRILDGFEGAGIPAMAFKGPVLALETTGNLADRFFRDLDVLVPAHRALEARRLLESDGLVAEHAPPDARVEAFLREGHEFVLRRPGGPTQIGLHWALAPRAFALDIDLDAMWERRRTIALGGRDVPTFDPIDTLLVLAIHGARHGWEELKYVVDLARFLARHADLEPGVCRERAARSGCRRILDLGLLLAGELLGGPVDASLLEPARADPIARRLAARIAERYLGRAPRQSIADRFLFELRVRERLADRVRLAARKILTPTLHDWAFVSLPRSLSPLYYLVRPVRLGRRLLPQGR